MYKIIITPNNTNIQLFIPQNYVGKKVEVLLYSIEELNDAKVEETKETKKPSDFIGCISKKRASSLLIQIQESRGELERNI